jgi:hypothetical protein
VIKPVALVNDMEGLIASGKACADERTQEFIFFIFTVVENTNVTILLKGRPGRSHSSCSNLRPDILPH